MYRYTSFIVLCCMLVVAGLANAALLNSPCPNVFAYEGEPEHDRWYGIITFSSNIELVGLIYKIQLDRPGQLLVSWDGEVRSDDNINFSVFDPKHFQRPGEVVKARIMVKFHPSSNPPNVVKIIINGNIMCSADVNIAYNPGFSIETSTPGRPDPVSLDEDIPVVPEYNNRPNLNSGNEKVTKPNYYDTNYNGGGGTGTNYNTVSAYGHQVESNYGNSMNYQPASNSRPSSYPNNNNNNPNYGGGGSVNAGYSTSGNNYVPAENVVYPSNHQSQPQQWSTENQQQQQTSYGNNNRNGSGQVVNNGPLVTTLTLPNNTQNKNNVDTIIQIIKNQLEQQQGASNTNNTVIVALVSPVNAGNQHAAQQTLPNAPLSRDSLVETTTHKTTTTSTQSSVVVVAKVRATTPSTPSTKNPNSRNKD